MPDISSTCFFGHADLLYNFWKHLVKIVALFLLVKSSRYEFQELLKNDCHILFYYDDEQIGHISDVFHEEVNKRDLSCSSGLYHCKSFQTLDFHRKLKIFYK